jgi:predicted ABC-type ATPase
MKKYLLLLSAIFLPMQLKASCEEFLQFVAAKNYTLQSTLGEQLYHEFLEDLTSEISPQLIAVGGPSGSGKTRFCKKLEQENFHMHDMDAVLLLLPSYQKDLKEFGPKTAFENGWPLAREIAQLIVRFAMEKGYSIIYDRTCGSELSYFDLLFAKERGYRMKFIGLYVTPEIAWSRIQQREEQEGRAVTEANAREYRARFSALWPYYLKLLEDIALYDNTEEMPRLIFSSEAGIIDAPIYQKFLEEGVSFKEQMDKKVNEKNYVP